MGLSASQARLLTITARLTSNEYESQQISNAKMRLATRSEQASAEYIAALNTQQLMYKTYDAKGDAISEDLTANSLYLFNDMRNQYMITNISGQALVMSEDAKNFETSDNLEEFLEKYGVYKIYKTETLEKNAYAITHTGDDSVTGYKGHYGYYNDWNVAVEFFENATYNYTNTPNGKDYSNLFAADAYSYERGLASNDYFAAQSKYEEALMKMKNGEEVGNLDAIIANLAHEKAKYANCMTFEQWAKSKAMYYPVDLNNPGTPVDVDYGNINYEQWEANGQYSDVYKNALGYFTALEEFETEAGSLGCNTVEDTYVYNNETKATWYTNLWYRMNGADTQKTSQGKNKTLYTRLDPKLAGSKNWLKDSLNSGSLILEVVSNKKSENFIPDLQNPFRTLIKGVNWSSIIHTSCVDIFKQDDDVAVARAEAEYQRKNNEIAIADKKYENKIKTLDSEHNALQTEYNEIQTQLGKSIDRSFKTFS